MITEETLKYFGDNLRTYKYRLFVEEGVDDEVNNFFHKMRCIPILGSEAFKKTITETYIEEKNKTRSLMKYTPNNTPMLIEEIANLVAKEFHEDPSALFQVKRGEKNTIRAIAIYQIHHQTDASREAISRLFGNIKPDAVTRICRRIHSQQLTDEGLANRIKKITNLIRSAEASA